VRINEVMTKSPASCHPDTPIRDVARIMVTCDCGSIPVIDGDRIVGIITDRDIVVRAVAADRCPLTLKVGDLMSRPVAVVHADEPLESALKMLEDNQIRRAPVLDNAGHLVGLISQADLARNTPSPLAGELLQCISKGIDVGHE
jgi:CBS domain-containing protein